MEIQQIKEKLTILEVLAHYGLNPNRNKMLCCPFHDDKNPSMQVYPETNTVHCFSGNGKHTGKAIDQIDFILHKEGCTKHEAILKAKKLLGETIITQVNKKHGTMSNLRELLNNFNKPCKGQKKPKTTLKAEAFSILSWKLVLSLPAMAVK